MGTAYQDDEENFGNISSTVVATAPLEVIPAWHAFFTQFLSSSQSNAEFFIDITNKRDLPIAESDWTRAMKKPLDSNHKGVKSRGDLEVTYYRVGVDASNGSVDGLVIRNLRSSVK